MRKKISFGLKITTATASLVGVLLSFFAAQNDGYSHWSKRLLYFTGLSNLWLSLTLIVLLLLFPFGRRADTVWGKRAYLLKYIFTVSITVTGFVYCAFLAPFADKSYHSWSFPNLLTHVFTPILGIADFFVDDTPIPLKKRHILYSTIPPLGYFVFASTLHLWNVDFGRGDTFPYFFLNLRSPAGVFGFSDQPPYIMGAFYWILLFLAMVLSFAGLYYIFKKKQQEK